MNKFKTESYYRELNKDSLCTCDYCRNYYKEVKAAYLEHFWYISRQFNSSVELIRELKKHIPEYSKSKSSFEILYPLTADAVSNCMKLDEHHMQSGPSGLTEFSNPRTDVYKLIEIILKDGRDYKREYLPIPGRPACNKKTEAFHHDKDTSYPDSLK